MSNHTLLLIDASSFIHRAFHAAPPVITTKGEHVGALNTTIKMLRNLVNDHKPKYIATVFDHPGNNFRHALYPAYKANRDQKPAELLFQIEQLRLFAGAMGLNPVRVPNVEADDVIATLAKSAAGTGVKVLVPTRDKDMAAIVSDLVSLLDKDGVITDPMRVQEKFGVPPHLISDWLALMGDDIDNIPGIDGCGEKKAAGLLAKFGSLDGIIANANFITGVLGERIRANIPQLTLMRQVVKLDDDLPIMRDHDQYLRRALNTEKLLELFDRFEFHDMRAKLLGHTQKASVTQ